jgi:hypothetical protein
MYGPVLKYSCPKFISLAPVDDVGHVDCMLNGHANSMSQIAYFLQGQSPILTTMSQWL